MNTKFLLCEIENKVAVVTISHAPGNKLNTQVYQEIAGLMGDLETNKNVHAIVITGAGDEAFVAGADINEMVDLDTVGMMDLTQITRIAFSRIEKLNKPVIAAINGLARGGGFELALSCDLRIASEKARIGFTFMQLAFCPDSGASHFLIQKVGYHKALELLWFGKIINAEEAEKLGLINKVVPHEECLPEAIRWAEKLALQPLMAVGLDKKLLREAGRNDYYQQTELEAMYQVLTWSSEDFKEGCAAFAEKRKPVFKNR